MDIFKSGLLEVNPGLIIWTVITFLILLLILWKAAWRPLVDALDFRAKKVRDDIETAEKNRQETEKLLAEHREAMEKAKDEALQIVAEGKADAEKLKTSILEKANKEASDALERAKKEITLAKDKAIDEIKAEVVNISTDIASKIISKNLNPEDQKSIVDEALSKIKTVQ